jgi:hypothetical protein
LRPAGQGEPGAQHVEGDGVVAEERGADADHRERVDDVDYRCGCGIAGDDEIAGEGAVRISNSPCVER